MAPKRGRGGGKAEQITSSSIGQLTSSIKNKQARSETYSKLKKIKQKEKKSARERGKLEEAKAEELGLERPKKIPRTIENTRVKDETMIAEDDEEELVAEEEQDEFAEYFNRTERPDVLITTNYKPSAIMFAFIADMLAVLPKATYYKRQGFPLKKIIKYASKKGFTDMIVFNEDRKKVNGMLLIHLPEGPTAHFKLSNLVLSKDIKNHGAPGNFKAELILKNFDTRLGRRVGRLFASLFDQDPNFRGRQAATLHNQRDFIFFRHHRYIFEERGRQDKKSGKSMVARLQELGPRFTLKLRSLQRGTFDSKAGEYEFVHKPDMNTNRRKFVL